MPKGLSIIIIVTVTFFLSPLYIIKSGCDFTVLPLELRRVVMIEWEGSFGNLMTERNDWWRDVVIALLAVVE